MNTTLFPGMDGPALAGRSTGTAAADSTEPSRLRRPERGQLLLEAVCLEDRLPADHAARLIWRVVEGLDRSRFYETIAARDREPGRAATDPKLLVALWLYAAVDGVGNGRKLHRLCQQHDAYKEEWWFEYDPLYACPQRRPRRRREENGAWPGRYQGEEEGPAGSEGASVFGHDGST